MANGTDTRITDNIAELRSAIDGIDGLSAIPGNVIIID
jgi:hypothetical protein